jgi:hypothetical protein
MIFSSQGEFPSNMSRYYANKLNKLFEGDINNGEIDDTLKEAINKFKEAINKYNSTQISDINSPQKSFNSIKSQLKECKLCKFKLEKISSIRAFLIQAESKNFKSLQRESKLSNIIQNITTISDNFIKTFIYDFQEITPPQGSYSVIDYDKIYSKLFQNYCDIYQAINQEKEERDGNNPDLRPAFLSPLPLRTVYAKPLCSTKLPNLTTTTSKKNLPSAQPQLRRGGINPLINFYKRLELENGLQHYYNK